MWDASQYLKFADDRARPFHDLLARVPAGDCATIADLGCGPGHLTRVIADRWPNACVIGVDSSAEMLEQAQTLAGRIGFVQADLVTWTPDVPLDLIVSNAALQWVPEHETVLARLAGLLSARGVLAVQVPYQHQSPAYIAIDAARDDDRWRDLLRGVGLTQDSVHPATWYVERLHALGFAVDAWQTTYIHVLRGENPVLEWFKGSALRPLLARLPADKQAEFLHEVGVRLFAAYPSRDGVTLLPFPRIFFVARASCGAG